MRKLIVAVCLLLVFSPWGRSEASTLIDVGATTFVVPQNGTLGLGGSVPAGAQGTFEIIGNPSFSDTGFAILDRSAMINGTTYDILTGLGTCPVDYCGSFPYVTTTEGTHVGPGGASLFPISSLDQSLTISSNIMLRQFSPGSNIAIPADYQLEVRVFLPPGIAPIPETSTWAMLLIGFVGFGVVSYRGSLNKPSIVELA
jgi:hypothetical protein